MAKPILVAFGSCTFFILDPFWFVTDPSCPWFWINNGQL